MIADNAIQTALPVDVPQTKVCPHCKNVKTMGHFGKNTNKADGCSRWCKECTRAYDAKLRQNPLKPGEKRCSNCLLSKPYDNFWPGKKGKTGKDGYHSWCKACEKESLVDWREKNKKINSEKNKKYIKTHKRDVWAKTTCGHHDAKQIKNEVVNLAKNTNHCPICNIELEYREEGFKGKTATLDRKDNGTIQTIGDVWIICNSCNRTKSDRSMPEFVAYCKMVADKFGGEYL